jgi:D-3-phosphoglycerate dehydrogenase
MNKVLISCPPMIKQRKLLEDKCLELNIIPTWAEVIQQYSEDDLIEFIGDFDGWIIGDDPCTRNVISKGKQGNLRALVKWGIGVDNVDFDACKEFGIPISNTPHMFGSEVANLAIGYMVCLDRKIIDVHNSVKNGDWFKPAGDSTKGKTAGILGLGDIGSAIAKRLQAMDLNIVGYDPYYQATPAFNFLRVEKWPNGIENLDYLFLACALNSSTKNIVNKIIFEKVKKSFKLINVSRGQLVNQNDLLEFLERGLIAAAALDVYEIEPVSKNDKILKFDNIILGSHNASNTVEAVIRTSNLALEKISQFLSK